MRVSLNLNGRMVLAAAVVAFVTVGLVTASMLVLAKQEMAEVLGKAQYGALSGAAAYVDHEIAGKRDLLRVAADGIPAGARRDAGKVRHFLRDQSTLHRAFFNVLAADPTGRVMASLSSAPDAAPDSIADRAYFVDTVGQRAGLVSAPLTSKSSDRAIVVITEPVFGVDGTLAFVLCGSLDLNSDGVFEQLQALSPGHSGYMTLLSADGTIIVHPDRRRILARVAEEKGGPTPNMTAAMNGFQGWTHGRNKSGVESLLTYRRLLTNNWLLASVYPVSEAYAPFERARTRSWYAAAAIAIMGALVAGTCIAVLMGPLQRLQRQLASFAETPGSLDEFNALSDDAFGKLSRAFRDATEKRLKCEAVLTVQATTDALTGMSNRRVFDSAIIHAVARSERDGTALAVAYLDVDRFKAINDTHGHGAGDQILIELSRRLRSAVRESDTLVRLAGDEFVMIFEGLTTPSEAGALGQKIVDMMAEPMHAGETLMPVTVSVGIYSAMPHGVTASNIIDRADAALYRAKRKGRNRCELELG